MIDDTAYLLAPSSEPQGEGMTAASWIVTLFPLVLLAPFFVMLVRLMRSSKAAQQRSLEHMTRMEAKTDRVIAALEGIREDLAKRER